MLFGFSAAASAQGFDAGVKLGYQSLTGDPGDTFDGALAWGLYGAWGFNPNISLRDSPRRSPRAEVTAFLSTRTCIWVSPLPMAVHQSTLSCMHLIIDES